MTNAELIAKIKAEIERLKVDYLNRSYTFVPVAMEHLLDFLSTLESEKPEKGIDVTDFCKPIDPGIAQCIADHSWEMLGEDEKPVPNDLEEAAGNIYKTPFGTRAEDFKAGAEWQKEQMLKEAVEGTIVDAGFDDHTALVSIPDKRYDEGDKVRIIIVKEDEK